MGMDSRRGLVGPLVILASRLSGGDDHGYRAEPLCLLSHSGRYARQGGLHSNGARRLGATAGTRRIGRMDRWLTMRARSHSAFFLHQKIHNKKATTTAARISSKKSPDIESHKPRFYCCKHAALLGNFTKDLPFLEMVPLSGSQQLG